MGHLGAEAILHLREQWRVGLRKQAFAQLCAFYSPKAGSISAVAIYQQPHPFLQN